MKTVDITRDDIKFMVTECIKNILSPQLLSESLSRYLYHFTTTNVLKNILNTNAFILSPSIGNQNDKTLNKNHLFYMSFTREYSNKVGYAAWKNEQLLSKTLKTIEDNKESRAQGKKPKQLPKISEFLNVRISVNGELLNNGFKGMPVNYHHKNIKQNKQQKLMKSDPLGRLKMLQSEDRLLTNKPYIENVSNYIERIDILLPKTFSQQSEEALIKNIKQVLMLSHKYNFTDKIFVYDNEEDFNTPKSLNFINDKIMSNLSQGLQNVLNGGTESNRMKSSFPKVNDFKEEPKELSGLKITYIACTLAILVELTSPARLKKFINYIFSFRKKYISQEQLNNEEINVWDKCWKVLDTKEEYRGDYNYKTDFLPGVFRGEARDIYVLMSALLSNVTKERGWNDSFQNLARQFGFPQSNDKKNRK